MDLGLRDKVAVITGGSVGIGLAIGKGLAAEGAQVVIGARNADRLEAARAEIAEAAKKLAERCMSGTMEPAQITEEALGAALQTADVPDPDLLIRTSGEQRISNFLLWQCAYAEFVFMPVLWPDFSADDLNRAIAEFNSRDRRFGGVESAKRLKA